jgi:hypothetical protein
MRKLFRWWALSEMDEEDGQAGLRVRDDEFSGTVLVCE